ncbi:DUF5706 domain-containing protein (plasmid) [Priestia aryabhattai]|uniref:Pycsar system effector family protein n=1 Tax=Priestia aryabhattai TaxID=412384 RepID=UPI0025A3E8CC|nr:Pycsar system effector family protein [Priestia aryabhattai]WJN47512.1 DUF5706 domain-containing protein [Priestia aryabhattai]
MSQESLVVENKDQHIQHRTKQGQLQKTIPSRNEDGMADLHQSKSEESPMHHPLSKVILDDRLKVEMKQTEGNLRNNFTNQQNVHLNNSIRFADTKAGVLSGANGLILTYVSDQLSDATSFSKIFLILGLVCLIVSILHSLWVVFPRFQNSKDKGLVYWEHVTNYSEDEYANAIIHGDTSELLRNSVENNYTQAIILTKKFKKLETGFIFCIGGYLLIMVGLLIKFI